MIDYAKQCVVKVQVSDFGENDNFQEWAMHDGTIDGLTSDATKENADSLKLDEEIGRAHV